MITSILVSLAGIGLAAALYLGSPRTLAILTRAMEAVGAYQVSRDKFYFDPIYNLLVVWPLQGIANLCAWLDRNLIDGLVNLCGWIPRAVGSMLRPLQGGMLQFYALAMVLGLLVLIGLLMM